MKKLFVLSLIFLGLLFSGVVAAPRPSAPFSWIGEIVYTPIEGGFYGIASRDGHKYLAHNLPKMLQRSGLAVQGKAVLRSEQLGFQQWGEAIQLLDISPLCPLPEAE